MNNEYKNSILIKDDYKDLLRKEIYEPIVLNIMNVTLNIVQIVLKNVKIVIVIYVFFV